jgi:hypothetical protein
LICVSIIASASAQDEEKSDTLKTKPSYKPTGIRIGVDAVSIIRSASDRTFEGWEVNADVDFHRYYLAVDYGYWARDFQSVDETASRFYSNSGNYWRVGIDVNFLKKDPDRNMFFFGARYGHATFSERLTIQASDAIWGSLNATHTNSRIPAQWFELTTGLRVKMWKFIWMGYTARFKFGLSNGDTPDMLPHDVPGYGTADKDSYWGFNYQLFFRIPIRKAPPVLVLPKK